MLSIFLISKQKHQDIVVGKFMFVEKKKTKQKILVAHISVVLVMCQYKVMLMHVVPVKYFRRASYLSFNKKAGQVLVYIFVWDCSMNM